MGLSVIIRWIDFGWATLMKPFASLPGDCVQVRAGIIRGKRTEFRIVQDLGACVSIREKVNMTV
jgi:hypothetical protein